MFLSKLDQGAIINGIRCDKYPDKKCDGIIITASCDIANEKVSKLYYIVGVEVDEWFTSAHGFYLAYNKSIEKKIDDNLEKYGLDAKTILNFNRTEAERVIKEYVNNKNDKDNLISHLTTFFNYKEANEEKRKNYKRIS